MLYCRWVVVAIVVLLVADARLARCQTRPPDPNRLAKPPGWYFPKSTYSATAKSATAKPGWYVPTGAIVMNPTSLHVGWFVPQVTATSDTTGGYNYQGMNRPGWYIGDTQSSERMTSLSMKMSGGHKASTATTSAALSRSSTAVAVDPTAEQSSAAAAPITSAVTQPRYYFERWNPKSVEMSDKTATQAKTGKRRARAGIFPYNSLQHAAASRAQQGVRTLAPGLTAETASTSVKTKSASSSLLSSGKRSPTSSLGRGKGSSLSK